MASVMTFAKRRVDGKVGQPRGRRRSSRGVRGSRENAGGRGACGNRDQRPALAERRALDRVAQNERKTGEEHGGRVPQATGMRQGLSGGQTVPTFITTVLREW